MGHVFAVRGDITHVACDAWLLPTDARLEVSRWTGIVRGLDEAVRGLGDRAADLRDGRTRALVLPDRPDDEPRPVLTTVPLQGIEHASDVHEPLRQGLAAAAGHARTRSGSRRGTPLVAMPLFGSGGGGGDEWRGALIRTALDTARSADTDVVLVLSDDADLSHAQAYRRSAGDWWSAIGPDRVRIATELAGKAKAGRLVPFLGAGVSITGGLPDWNGLVALLAEGWPVDDDVWAEFRRLPVLDQAEILQEHHGERAGFAAAIAEATTCTRYGLAPALLAGLPTREAVTLNYDTLYELASTDAGRHTAVLPWDAADSQDRWLLKLHGTVDRPESIVLTRRDYLSYRQGREALSALAKALLLTRHLLFVGFGLADDHFHEVVHDVRAVRRDGRTEKLGTALALSSSPLRDTLWGRDLDLVGFDGADDRERGRMLEIFLDCLLAHADTGLDHLLDERFGFLLSEPEQRLAARLRALADQTSDEEFATPAGGALAALLSDLGRPPRT